MIFHEVSEALRVAFRVDGAQAGWVLAEDQSLIEPLALLLNGPFLQVVDDGDVDNLLFVLEAMTFGHPFADRFLLTIPAVGACHQHVPVFLLRI